MIPRQLGPRNRGVGLTMPSKSVSQRQNNTKRTQTRIVSMISIKETAMKIADSTVLVTGANCGLRSPSREPSSTEWRKGEEDIFPDASYNHRKAC
jgi:hypothetical protein